MSFIIEHLNGSIYQLDEREGIEITDFTLSSPDSDTDITTLDGSDGHIDHGTRFNGRESSLEMILYGEDFISRRNNLFRIFDSRNPFYLIDQREPDRRWRCKVNGSFSPNNISPFVAEVQINLISDSAYSQSIETTLQQDESAYIFESTTFNVFNDGDVEIDPRSTKTPLVIRFQGASEYLQIHNLNTGDLWEIEEVTNEGSVLVLDGVQVLLNNESAFRRSNQSVIRLQPGENTIQINNAQSGFTISFDFHRFYM